MRMICHVVLAVLVLKTLCFAENLDRQKQLIQHVKNSIQQARKESSQLTEPILKIEGMSSRKVRHLLNNLCMLKDGAYLEVGCWKGSTLISAVYQNQETLKDVVVIENWKEFNGPKNAFMNNVRLHLSQPIRFIESDAFSVNLANTFKEPISIYFYDGGHSLAAQKAAFTYFNPILDDIFIAVVDDWNWSDVYEGTWAAFKELNYKILHIEELFVPVLGDASSWWNGVLVAVIQK